MTKMQTVAVAIAAFALALPAAAQTTHPDKSGSASSSTRSGTPSSSNSNSSGGTSEAMLTAKVHAAMAKDPGLKTLAINVDSVGNNVTLKGQVDSETTRKKAEQAAKQVEGVGTVHNELTVKPKS
jgi:hyperosmotically inducible protein